MMFFPGIALNVRRRSDTNIGATEHSIHMVVFSTLVKEQKQVKGIMVLTTY
jgi:hypothetical protein